MKAKDEHKLNYPSHETNYLKTQLVAKEKEIEKLKAELKEDDEHYWNQSWVTTEKDGKRLDRLIRMLEKKVKKCQDDEKIIKFVNAIGFITAKKKEYQDDVLGIKKILRNNK